MKERHDVHQKMEKVRHWLRLDKLPAPVRKVVVCVAGAVLIVGGVVLIILPVVPGFFFIPIGLFLLASEFKWAECWAQKLVDSFDSVRAKWRAWKRRRAAQAKP